MKLRLSVEPSPLPTHTQSPCSRSTIVAVEAPNVPLGVLALAMFLKSFTIAHIKNPGAIGFLYMCS